MRFSRTKLVPFQTRFVDIWRHYAGNQHDEDDFDRMLPMNVVRMALDIWSRGLAARAPQCRINTRNPGLRPQAHEHQLALEHLIREIKFAKSLRATVKSALALMGIMKVGLTDAPMGESISVYHDAGQVFADNVLFGDWIHDMNARTVEEWEFCGNRYRVPLEDVKNNPMFQNTEQLQATSNEDSLANPGGYGDQETRVETITQGASNLAAEEYVEHVELWDIWLPRENLLVTLPGHGEGKPLLVTEWTGPERGPYHILCFGDIPGNVVPTGAVSTLMDVHDLLNRMFCKLGDQADRQKTVFAATQAAVADGSAMARINASDGEVISTAHPDAIREMRSGGVDQQTLAFVGWLRGIANYVGGNFDTIGGLQSGAETLGQEKLLVQQSNGLMDDMQATVELFAKDVLTDMAWWQYTNPELTLRLTKTSRSGAISIPFDWGPESREADFFEYSFDIVPFSSAPQTPKDKAQLLSNFVRQEVLPMQQAGILDRAQLQFDPQEYFRTMADLLSAPEINTFLRVNGGYLPSEPPGISTAESGMPANTTRNYVRRSESPGQNGLAGVERDMMQGAMGASMPQGTNPSMMPQGA